MTAVLEKNATAVDYGTADRCLHELFEERVRLDPTAPAVRFGAAELSYGELDDEANRLAAHLRMLGAGPETVVGVLLERGDRLPVTLLAVLKAGAAYLPLDPGHPPERLAYLVEDAAVELVVTVSDLAGGLPADAFAVCLDDPGVRECLAEPVAPVASGARPDNLAYVIYTSGSTGKPKGTLVPHRTVVNLVAYSAREYGIGPGDRVLQFASPAFDVSVSDFFTTLTSGATLVQAPRLTLVDPRALTAVLRGERVTVGDIPPAVLRLLDPAVLPDLRLLHVGGEALTEDEAHRWMAPGRSVYHRYGPTETTVCCTDHRCVPGEGAPPIGGPLGNQRVHVLGPAGGELSPGEEGELYVGGAGVSRGYLARPGLTAERFLPDPFGPPGARLYRTGDLARRRTDGEVEFLGRADAQLKLNGHRVEPGEVEAAVLEHPGVVGAVVGLHTGAGGDRVLAAHVVVAPGAAVPTVGELRAHLRDRLPAALVPGRVVALDAVPLTPNGKIDRRAVVF
ncbi:amino acid adenylation domain-containing protein [Amycolatopsis sp. NPDC049253]|uniref:non-ribosomal peptide synthetase n=1 Tax=Amycolatopsis sp. NPDC049253 TaxID=3155274 RepID=UPI00343561DB